MWFIYVCTSIFYFATVSASMSFFMGSFIQVKAMVHDMEAIVLELNQRTLAKCETNGRSMSTKQMMVEAIELYNTMFE